MGAEEQKSKDPIVEDVFQNGGLVDFVEADVVDGDHH